MTVVVTDGKSAEYEEWAKGCYLKNVYRGNKLSSLSAGFEKLDKGTVMPVDVEWDIVCHVLEGSMRVESEGKTYPVKKGDFFNFTKGTKVEIHADEDVKAIFACFPKYED